MANNQLSSAVMARVTAEFERVLSEAVPVYEIGQMGLFNDDVESYIRKEVERKLYEPKLPNAGDRERKWVERLEKLAGDREWAYAGRAYHAATRVKLLLPKEPWNAGKYYERSPLTVRTGKQDFEFLTAMRDIAEANRQWDRKWFAELLLGGLPEEVSNFRIECLYLLKMPDGQIERRVRLRNVLGETSGEINLDSKAFASPEKFRDYCLSKGNFAWSGNQTALQALHADICAEAAWKVINLVVSLGWHPLEARPKVRPDGQDAPTLDGVYFMGDCAYRNGVRLELNEGCYWIAQKDEEGNDLPAEGWQLADEGRENPFYHKKPLLRPAVRITDVKLRLHPNYDPPSPLGGTLGLPAKPGEAQLLARFFRETCLRLKNICGPAAHLIIGSVLGFAAAPEIFHKSSLFPGLWLHGSMNSGKSTILEWMMEIFGLSLHSGIILRGNNSTPTGLLQAVDQYSNIPVWLDEFRAAEVGDDKKAVIHNFYNRGGQAKFSMTKLQRSIRTNALISGESTSQDSALRSRFPHLQIAKSLRTGTPEEQKDNYEWFVAHRQHFRLFGLWLLEHRNAFAEQVLKEMLRWDEEDIDQRIKTVYGVGYAAWLAFWKLLMEEVDGSAVVFAPEEIREFRVWLLEHARQAVTDVVSETNINVFWMDLLAAVKSGAIPAECFWLEWMEGLPPGVEMPADHSLPQGAWRRFQIFIEPNLLLAELQKEMVKQRGNVVLKRKDLRDQFSKEKWWLGSSLRKRFARGTAGGVPAWGVEVDLHPLGGQSVSDAEYAEYRSKSVLNEDDGDPRKGLLFELVDWLIEKQRCRGTVQ